MKKIKKDENGSVTIIAIALCSVALMFSIGLSKLGGFAGIKAKAQNAADAASLSAAYDIAHFNPSTACTSADRTAEKNGAKLESCQHSNNDVEVIVSIDHDGKAVSATAKADIK